MLVKIVICLAIVQCARAQATVTYVNPFQNSFAISTPHLQQSFSTKIRTPFGNQLQQQMQQPQFNPQFNPQVQPQVQIQPQFQFNPALQNAQYAQANAQNAPYTNAQYAQTQSGQFYYVPTNGLEQTGQFMTAAQLQQLQQYQQALAQQTLAQQTLAQTYPQQFPQQTENAPEQFTARNGLVAAQRDQGQARVSNERIQVSERAQEQLPQMQVDNALVKAQYSAQTLAKLQQQANLLFLAQQRFLGQNLERTTGLKEAQGEDGTKEDA